MKQTAQMRPRIHFSWIPSRGSAWPAPLQHSKSDQSWTWIYLSVWAGWCPVLERLMEARLLLARFLPALSPLYRQWGETVLQGWLHHF